jgi:DMSO/TMAO reductase YedYZ molybdopterin-dependent catalytic subunit
LDGLAGYVNSAASDNLRIDGFSVQGAKAIDENTLVAYEMNGEALPHWNGYPARLIVPGWTATDWMKHLIEVQALKEPLKSFWMSPAYRIGQVR